MRGSTDVLRRPGRDAAVVEHNDGGLFPALNWGDPVDADGDFLLSVGTVTVLVADVVAEHEWSGTEVIEAVSEVVGRHGGVQPLDDRPPESVVAAFARPSEAAACAVAVHEKLGAAAGRVRVAIHAAEAHPSTDRVFVGAALERAGRLRDAGHGGQVLLSQAAADLVADRLPAGAELRDLGAHRLLDGARRERIVQLVHPALPVEFPPLRTIDSYRHNLPEYRTPLFGRSSHIDAVAELVRAERVVTLHAGGGCGKTRLAVAVAAGLVEELPDGVWFCDLSNATGRSAVERAVLDGLRLAAEGPAALTPYVSGKHLLLILDNCEHVVADCAALVDELVTAATTCRVLATSREPLGVSGEVVYRVPSLEVPPHVPLTEIAALTPYAAAELFVDRARRVANDFAPTVDDITAIADICRRLDGVPLAIELAAARVRGLTVTEIAAGLDERFRLLTGGARTAVPRQQTLHASIDWSHSLLTVPEQLVFRRLAVFVGGFDLAAARAVTAGDGVEAQQVVDLLLLLVDKSLVVADQTADGMRYRLLESVRQFALGRLDASGERDLVRAAHRRHYASFGDRFSRADLTRYVATAIAGEHVPDVANLWAAYDDAAGASDSVSLVRIAIAVQLYDGGRAPALDAAAAALADVDPVSRVTFTIVTSFRDVFRLADPEGDAAACRAAGYPARARLLELSMRLRRGGPDLPTIAELDTVVRELEASNDVLAQFWGHGGLLVTVEWIVPDVDLISFRRRFDRAMRDLLGEPLCFASGGRPFHLVVKGSAREALSVVESYVDDVGGWVRAAALADRAIALLQLAELERAGDALDDAGRAVDEAGREGSGNVVMVGRGWLEAASGDHAAAARLLEEAMRRIVARADPDGIAQLVTASALLVEALVVLGRLDDVDGVIAKARPLAYPSWLAAWVHRADAVVAIARGSLDVAEEAAHAMLSGAAPYSFVLNVATALELLGIAATAADSPIEAARLLGAAAALRQDEGCLLRTEPLTGWRAAAMVDARRSAGDEAFHAAFAEGTALPWRDAVAYARRGRGERKRPATGWASLTPAEEQVIALVGEGLANRDVAARLFISPRTVGSHLSHIYSKLGLGSRSELVAAAAARVHGRQT
jgi:predicted ATPase/DNA-binding CsgD family transcriptional regulator